MCCSGVSCSHIHSTLSIRSFYELCCFARVSHPTITSLHCLQGLPRLYSLEKAYANARQKNYVERDLRRRNCLSALSQMSSATVASPDSRSRICDGLGLSPSEPHRRCQVASAPRQNNLTALSNPYKGEKCQSGVVTAQRPTYSHLCNPSELTQARTLVLVLCPHATVGKIGGWNPGENLSSWPGEGPYPANPVQSGQTAPH